MNPKFIMGPKVIFHSCFSVAETEVSREYAIHVKILWTEPEESTCSIIQAADYKSERN